MATDQTPPRNLRILLATLVATGVLMTLSVVFRQYFASSVELGVAQNVLNLDQPEAARRWGKPLRDYRTREFHALRSSPLPIEDAIDKLATQGRMSAPEIAPQPSEDRASLEGWNGLRR